MARSLIAVLAIALACGCAPGDGEQIKAEAKKNAARQQKLAETQARQRAARAKQDEIRRQNEAVAQRQIDEAKAEFLRQYPYYPLAYTVDSATVGEGFVSMKIAGEVKNIGESDARAVWIEFDILDNQGRKVGTASDMVSGLRSGQTWRYSAVWRSRADEQWGFKYQLSKLDGR
jgi:hypothetical protein